MISTLHVLLQAEAEAAARSHTDRMAELQESCHRKVHQVRADLERQLAAAHTSAAAALAEQAAPAAAAAAAGGLARPAGLSPLTSMGALSGQATAHGLSGLAAGDHSLLRDGITCLDGLGGRCHLTL